ncbi:mitochondrial carrier domain-containing protein [Cladorrhinum sp. PSN332]|nr:mitochondrial carrier domain-containing protein [Cladorrhinum sp. PSN332]
MSADFWAGYLSGAASIIIGNPLDVLKVRLQASSSSPTSTSPLSQPSSSQSKFLVGTAAPILTYGALNALLFVSYNRTQSFLSAHLPPADAASLPSLTNTFASGCVAGLATFFVSTPTELIKCRAQLSTTTPSRPAEPKSSWAIAKSIYKSQGIKGLYFGGTVTAIRDSVGYGFYFWGYELSSRWLPALVPVENETVKTLVCGGLAGILTWASIFPLDVVKTRVQGQVLEVHVGSRGEQEGLLGRGEARVRVKGAWEVMRVTWREEGIRPFWRGLGICSLRAFVVNAVQWGVYEWIMAELGEGRDKRGGRVEDGIVL